MVKLGKAKLSASWSEVEGDGERARELGGTMAAGGSASALLASERSEEEAERVRKAAARPPLQAGQRAAWSGRAGRVAATRWSPSGLGRP